MEGHHPFDRLKALCAHLRSPEGCPWDREQTFESLQAYVVEEAYEVVDAIAVGEPEALAEELGDLLFQVIFVAQLAEERGWFDVYRVCELTHAKMVARHPHVFGALRVANAQEVVQNWEKIKKNEKKRGALAGVPETLPALLKALRITEKAAALGFDWEKPQDVLEKVREEVGELEEVVARSQGEADQSVREEFGDLLFSLANVARHLKIDPEAALQAANRKFAQRFSRMEDLASAQGMTLEGCTPEQLETLWEHVKQHADR